MKTADEIYADMLACFEAGAGHGINEGCDMAVRMRAAATAIEEANARSEWVKRQCFPQTAEGEYLDMHAEMRGVTRVAAVKASGILGFHTPMALSAPLTVPAGTVCVTAAGLGFITTETAEIQAGSLACEALAECLSSGSRGNVAAGTVAFMTSAPAGVSSCTNAAPFSGGRDAESDDELRVRVVGSFRRLPNGANKAYYESETLSVDGVAAVTVAPRARGVGTVDVTVSGLAGAPSSALLQAVADKLNASREICVDLAVSAPTAVAVSVVAAVDAEDGFDAAAVRAAVANALTAYFDGRLLGKDVLRAKLGSVIFGVFGVKNYTLTSPAADVSIAGGELPVLSAVNVSAWS